MWILDKYELIVGFIIIICFSLWVGKLIFWDFPRMVVEMKKEPGLLKPWIYYILGMVSFTVFLSLVSDDRGNIFWMAIAIVAPIAFLMILYSPDIDDNR